MRVAAVGAFTRGQPKIKGREWSIDTRNIKTIEVNDTVHCFQDEMRFFHYYFRPVKRFFLKLKIS
uniref:Uncharacterized protein n=1 Tax=Setaria digitata TaxID=48799 RepID=A0A915Q418_9BILA